MFVVVVEDREEVVVAGVQCRVRAISAFGRASDCLPAVSVAFAFAINDQVATDSRVLGGRAAAGVRR